MKGSKIGSRQSRIELELSTEEVSNPFLGPLSPKTCINQKYAGVDTLSEYLFRLAKEARIPDHGAIMLEQAFDEGRAILCLDSLDEVKPELRSDMIHLINTYAASTGNIWIIGSRFTEYKGGQFQRGQFAEWELQPMTHRLRQELAHRLLPELDRHFRCYQNQIRAEPLAFVYRLEAHSQAATGGENPLLFSLAAVVFVRLGALRDHSISGASSTLALCQLAGRSATSNLKVLRTIQN